MNDTEAADFCAGLPAAQLSFPFGLDTRVYKVVGRVFAIFGGTSQITLKADPEDARAQVETFDDVVPGYHMNKKHWVSVDLPTRGAPLAEMIRDSYDLVVAKLPRAERPTP